MKILTPMFGYVDKLLPFAYIQGAEQDVFFFALFCVPADSLQRIVRVTNGFLGLFGTCLRRFNGWILIMVCEGQFRDRSYLLHESFMNIAIQRFKG